MGMFTNTGSKMREGIGSVIGEKTRIKGEFITEGSVHVDGEFEGVLKAGREVVVAAGARVMGEIEGGSVIVSGQVDGNIRAKDTLEIAKTGKVNGDLAGARIVIEEGSSYHGRVAVETGAPVQQPA